MGTYSSVMTKFNLIFLIACTALAKANAEELYEPDRFFVKQIQPILENRCYECHSHQHHADGGLVLDSRAGWESGGDHGPAVRPKDLKRSPLIHAIRSHDSDSAMPPDEKLPAIEIAMLETWVLLGAPDPRVKEPTKPAKSKDSVKPAKTEKVTKD